MPPSWPGQVSALWGAPGNPSSPWRIVLRCRWGDGVPLVVCGLNPSTASPSAGPDATCQRWLAMAQRWGFPALTVVNLFPLRATSPKDMERGVFAIAGHPSRHVGRYPGHGQVFTDYCTTMTAALSEGDFILASWGSGGAGGDRLLARYYGTGDNPPRPLAYLHRTPEGCPIHPLARIKGVEVSKLRPRDWTTGELLRAASTTPPAFGADPA